MREFGDGVWESQREPENEGGTQQDVERSRPFAGGQLIDGDEHGNEEEKPNPTEGT